MEIAPFGSTFIDAYLLYHAHSYLPQLYHNSLSIARSTFRRLSHNDLSADRQFDGLAIVQVRERNRNGMTDVFATRWTSGTSRAASKKHAKQVFASSSGSIVVDALQAVLVVFGSLLFVAQYFVCRVNLLKEMFISALK